MRWGEFEAAESDIAAFARGEIDRKRVMLVGTLRKDGSPRISVVEPCILQGELCLGMMWRSRKALDLLRDQRLVLHNAICSSTGDEGEINLRGRALEITDPNIRENFVVAMSDRATWKEPHFHLFSVDVEGAALIKYERGEEQSVKVWPEGIEFRRPYG